MGEDVVGEDVEGHSTYSTSVHALFVNIYGFCVTPLKFHSHIFCSNCSAPSNIRAMDLTDDTSQLEISLLKSVAKLSILSMVVKADASQLEISLLKSVSK